jgi:serine/threonine protein kinase
VTALGESGPRSSKLGRYELITRIGQGGMAEVQLALQRGPAGFEKLVVVKLVHENLASQKAFVDMLLDEARVAALVKHPNVVDIYDLGEAGGRYFIAMEYLEGEPLLAVLRAGREGKRLDVLSTARLIADTAEGLDAAHELRSMAGDPLELVHHDVSLGNIVVLYNGQVKLVDFGVAKATQSAAARKRLGGKFGYMAPEKLRGAPGDRRSDIWSLGCVLWEALTLKRLFKGGNDSDTMQQVLESEIPLPSKVNGDIPADLDPVVMRALARDPAKRYPTAKEMAADLEAVLRKLGYAAKNDMIAKYMQTTFESHITARKKLLQEVSSKGGASAAVLEAAFADAGLASGSPIHTTGDFSARYKRSTEIPPIRGADAQDLVFPRASADQVERFGNDKSSPRIEPLAPPPLPASGFEDRTDVTPPIVSPRRKLPLEVYGGIAALILVVIVVGIVKLAGGSHGDELTQLPPLPEPSSARPIAVERPDAAVVLAPPADAAEAPIASGSGAGSGSASEPPQIEMSPENVAKPPPPPPRRPPPPRVTAPASEPKLNAEETTRTAFQAWVKGDNKTAIALYKKVIASNPGYAPAWRQLGSLYEKAGEKGAAKSAFTRYLALVPNAPDAPQIKQKLESP